MSEIVLVRHAQSDANMASAWQGRGDGALSEEGTRQAEALGTRLAAVEFDLVVSSPLRRARDTAAHLGDPEIEDDLTEVDLGRWEGASFADVFDAHGPLLRSIYQGADERFGETGERLSDVAARVWPVIDRVAARIGEDGTAVLVTHGGVIDAVFGTLLPSLSRRPHHMAANASLTHIRGRPGAWRLARFNDAAHVWRRPQWVDHHLSEGGAVLALIRHGRTRANAEGRCQGQSCWGLDDVGHAQAKLLAEWYGPFTTVFSSPLQRAAATARALAASAVTEVPGLAEIGMGRWEGLDWDEVVRRWPDLVRRIYEDGEDLPRGETGERWRDVVDRITEAVGSLEGVNGEVAGVVTHGGAIRAYLGTLGGDLSAAKSTLVTPENTSVTHIALTDDGPVLCDYAVAPHLEASVS